MAETGGEAPSEHGPSARAELLSPGRLKLMLSVLVLELAVFFTAMLIPVDSATRDSLMSQANSISGEAKNPNTLQVFAFILKNNATVAIVEFLPLLGVIAWIIVTYTTGQVVQVMATSSGLPGILAGYALFLFPFAIVELSAYAAAVGSGVMLLVAWRRRSLRVEAKVFALEAGVVFGMLGVAAAMEATTLASPVVGLALWVPLLGVIVGLAMKLRRAQP